jgi:hypothetical protein
MCGAPHPGERCRVAPHHSRHAEPMIREYVNCGMLMRGLVQMSRSACKLLAANVGSPSCLQAGGAKCGFIGGDCEPRPPLVGAECEPKTTLVCESTAHCLRAATGRGNGPGKAPRAGMWHGCRGWGYMGRNGEEWCGESRGVEYTKAARTWRLRVWRGQEACAPARGRGRLRGA